MDKIHEKTNDIAYALNRDGTLSVVGLLHRHLQQVVIPDAVDGRAVTRIGEWAFAMCDDLTDIALPKTLQSIGDRAFAACKRLRCVTFPDSLRMIGDRAFFDCPELDVVSITSSVRHIGDGAFALCGLNSIHVSADNKHYAAIDGCLIDTDSNLLIAGCNRSVIPNDGSVYAIGEGAFAKCGELESITIPGSVYRIGETAFYACQALEEVTILPGTGTIKSEAFMRCERLTTVHLPDTLTCIDSAAFRFCGKLEQITIPASVNYIGEMAFADCRSLVRVHFADPNGWTVDGAHVDVSDPVRAARMLGQGNGEWIKKQ